MPTVAYVSAKRLRVLIDESFRVEASAMCVLTTRRNARGELWRIDLEDHAHALDRANGKRYLPGPLNCFVLRWPRTLLVMRSVVRCVLDVIAQPAGGAPVGTSIATSETSYTKVALKAHACRVAAFLTAVVSG
jgi:hypothetical protein